MKIFDSFLKREPKKDKKEYYYKKLIKGGHTFEFEIQVGFTLKHGDKYCLYNKIVDGVNDNWATRGTYDFDKECNERMDWFLKIEAQHLVSSKYIKERIEYLTNNGFEKK